MRLPEKGNSNSHGARPVQLIITMIKYIRTSRLSIENSLSSAGVSRTWTLPALRQGLETSRRSCLVADRATLPQMWPPPPQSVADSCEVTATTEQTELSVSRGRVVPAEGCNPLPQRQGIAVFR